MRQPYWKPQHEVFIHGMLAHGNKTKAYNDAYPGVSPTSARKAANRLLKYTHIRERIEPVFERARNKAMQQLELAAGTRIANDLTTVYERRILLAGIIRGEITLQRAIRLKGRIEVAEQDMDPFVVLKAIELDCRLEAGYSWPTHDDIIQRQQDRINHYLNSPNGQGVPAWLQIDTDWRPKLPQASISSFYPSAFCNKNSP
ncbi:hypothetical protein [Polluticoccus soli]|uniref:hypothetical protein n=1 Tax=Polluticoccus soli TaxID=3034150 RepID=UPI0023E23B82|nr:hypothetical protein [Flavipsychrobacter sp. JY13-12]